MRGKQAPPARVPTASTPLLPCPSCGKLCRGAKGLAAHQRRAHGLRMQARYYVLGTKCPCCGVDFHTRPRALHHLQYDSKHCRAKMHEGSLPRFPDKQVHETDRQDAAAVRGAVARGETRTRALFPPLAP